METIDISTTKKYTKDLTLLYAEDDIDLQNNTKELFESLFKSVTIANNGKEALEFYNKNEKAPIFHYPGFCRESYTADIT